MRLMLAQRNPAVAAARSIQSGANCSYIALSPAQGVGADPGAQIQAHVEGTRSECRITRDWRASAVEISTSRTRNIS